MGNYICYENPIISLQCKYEELTREKIVYDLLHSLKKDAKSFLYKNAIVSNRFIQLIKFDVIWQVYLFTNKTFWQIGFTRYRKIPNTCV